MGMRAQCRAPRRVRTYRAIAHRAAARKARDMAWRAVVRKAILTDMAPSWAKAVASAVAARRGRNMVFLSGLVVGTNKGAHVTRTKGAMRGDVVAYAGLASVTVMIGGGQRGWQGRGHGMGLWRGSQSGQQCHIWWATERRGVIKSLAYSLANIASSKLKAQTPRRRSPMKAARAISADRIIMPHSLRVGIEVATTACATVRLALAVRPSPPSFDATLPVVLFFRPEVVPVTFTLNVHDEFAAIAPPVKLTLPDPAVGANVPPQVSVTPASGFDTTRPAGSGSLTATPLNAVKAFGLVIVKVSEVDPFSGRFDVPNAFAIVGGEAAFTVMLATAVRPTPPSVELIAPVVLFFRPGVVPVTFTLNVHDEFAATVPPVKLTLISPAVGVNVPQVLAAPVGFDTTRPAGRGSMIPTPVNAVEAFGLEIVKVSEVDPFSAKFDVPNAFATVGAEAVGKLRLNAPPLVASP